jgi:hypothetical protein
MKSRMSISACLLVLVLLAIAPASGITVSGVALVTDVSPGDRIMYNMTVDVGEVSEPVDVEAHVIAFTHDLECNRVRIPDNETSPGTARDFLKVSPERATIEPGEKAVFTLEGIVPEDVGDGGRYALVGISTVPSGNETVGFSSGVDVPVFLTIAGSEIIETGEMIGLNLSEGDDGGLVAEMLFEHTGNHHYKASAEFVLKDDEGNIVDEVAYPSRCSLLPSTKRGCAIPIGSEADLVPGSYTVEARVIKQDGTVLATKEATIEV